LCFVVALVLGSGCVTAPTPEHGSTVVWGYVRLVPKAGTDAQGGGYGDRRLAAVERVDYSRPRYAVVFAAEEVGPTKRAVELVIREIGPTSRLEPAFASTTPETGLAIRNQTAVERIVSIPEAGRLHRLEPGDSVLITGLEPGEASVHLLGMADPDASEPTRVWVSKGITVEVEKSGRYVLRGLPPGLHRLRAWHPRLPPSPEHEVVLRPDEARRLDIEIGLDAREPDREATR
jgi:hypothetical protein